MADFEDLIPIVLIAALIFLVWIFGWAPLSSEFTAYPIRCEQTNKKTICKNLDALNFKVFEDSQKVVAWLDGGFPVALPSCAVRNKNDWACIDSSSAGPSVVDGKFQSFPKQDGVSYVAKWRWWGIKLGLITS